MNHKQIPPPIGFPFFGWNEDGIKNYIIDTPLAAGDLMIVYNGQGGVHQYFLAKVINPALGKQSRVVLSKNGNYGGTSFYRSGKNCFAPTGQTKMLPPIPELMAHLSEDTDVILSSIIY